MGRWIIGLLVLMLAACATPPSPPPSVPPPSDPVATTTGKRIALTFDDIPRTPGPFLTEDERTAHLIAALKDAGVDQAAFFLNPGHIAERPGAEERIAAYVAAGHVIANHSNTHPRLSQTDTATYLADIDAAEAQLKGAPDTGHGSASPISTKGSATRRSAMQCGPVWMRAACLMAMSRLRPRIGGWNRRRLMR